MRVREMEIGEVQERFANLVWDNEPIPSGQLVKLCEQVFQWKKPTTYTVLRKLCEKGLFQNVNGVVSSVMSREEFASRRSEQFVDNAFHGSLPAFVAAFTAQKPLSAQEAEEIQEMISKFRKGGMTRALPDLPGGGGYERQRRTSGAGHPGGAAGDPAADAQVGQLPAVGAGGSVPDVPGAAGKRSQRPAPAGAGGASRRRGHGDGLPRP